MSPLMYLGIRDVGVGGSFFRDVILAPLWETAVFQGLLVGVPLALVRSSWNTLWLQDREFDRMVKVSIVLGSTLLSSYLFATLHEPGHFIAVFKAWKAKRLVRQIEGAWVWRDYRSSRKLAGELLPLANDLWLLQGSAYWRFLQAFSIFVLLSDSSKAHPPEMRARVRRIVREVGVFRNEVFASIE